MSFTPDLAKLESAIYLVRGQRVMLDADLAEIYQVSTKRLNEQRQRNQSRFPKDFAFQLTKAEFADLRSQIATSRAHGGRRYLPWVFTEHGAIMLASVLNSEVAVAASVRVVRAFVQLREMIAAHEELSHRLGELERKMDTHDEAIVRLFATLRQMLNPPTPKAKPEIGFHVRERSGSYRVKRRKA
ncbi:MAG: ORF6N domain-containing protein [Rhodanobacteraceae bacterium]